MAILPGIFAKIIFIGLSDHLFLDHYREEPGRQTARSTGISAVPASGTLSHTGE
jgi:hypothetical protein